MSAFWILCFVSLLICVVVVNGFCTMGSHDGINARPRSFKPDMGPSFRPLVAVGLFGGLFSGGGNRGSTSAYVTKDSNRGATNTVIRTVNGIRHRRLGGGDIIVSEVGLGTQRWVSEDFNAPDEAMCMKFMDKAILESGVNLIDTAEQYPIPSGPRHPEGGVEKVIGKWLAQDPSRRSKVVIATKITGGRNVNRKNIFADLEGSLRRLRTDYVDVYQLHWPARYSPQANWGQSLQYHHEVEPYFKGTTGFEEIVMAMGELVQQGKIRGWGMCNDNAFGLTASCEIAKRLNMPPPVSMQNDFSLIDRRAEENGVSEASSPLYENVGFMAYNALAGGVLTGKYLDGPPPTTDNSNLDEAQQTLENPRGRHDELNWGRTLYRYRSGPAEDATKRYVKLAGKFGMSPLELSLRWCKDRHLVTTTLLGQTSMKQLEEDLTIFRKHEPLPDELLWEIDRVHMRNRLPIFSSTRVGADWNGEGEIGELIP